MAKNNKIKLIKNEFTQYVCTSIAYFKSAMYSDKSDTLHWNAHIEI